MEIPDVSVGNPWEIPDLSTAVHGWSVPSILSAPTTPGDERDETGQLPLVRPVEPRFNNGTGC